MSHDQFFKAVFGQPEHAAAYFRSHLPPEIVAQADLSTATLCPGSFVDEQLGERHTDLLYQLQLAGHTALIYVLFEHQRSCDKTMIFRLLRYMIRIWERWLDEHAIDLGLPPIIPLVLYQGRQSWTAATRLSELLSPEVARQKVFRRFFPDFEMILSDLSGCRDEDLTGTALMRLTLYLFKHIDSPDILPLLQGWMETVRQICQESGLNGLRLALQYVLQAGQQVSPEALGALLATEVGDDAREMAMTTADILRAEGRAEGRKEGLKKGRRKGRKEGALQGRRAILLRLLEARFGRLPKEAKARVRSARISQLDDWAERILLASALDELLDARASG